MLEKHRYKLEEYYSANYRKIHTNSSISLGDKFMHSKLSGSTKHAKLGSILEIGSGNFEHFYFENNFDKYTSVDIRQPNETALSEYLSVSSAETFFKLTDGGTLPFTEGEFDTLVATCVALHVENYDEALTDRIRVVRPGGVIKFVVLCETSPMLKLIRLLFSYRSARKFGISRTDYDLINALDHVNSYERIKVITKAVLMPENDLKITFYPFSFIRSQSFNVFAIYKIQKASK